MLKRISFALWRRLLLSIFLTSSIVAYGADKSELSLQYIDGDTEWSREDQQFFTTDSQVIVHGEKVLPTNIAADTAVQLMASAPKVKLAERVVYHYGGPESKLRCDRYVKWGLLGQHCIAHSIKWKQHRFSIVMYGPNDMNPAQLKTIKDACFAAAVAPQLIGGFKIDSIVSILIGKRPTLELTLRSCVKTTESLGQIVEKDFELRIVEEHYW